VLAAGEAVKDAGVCPVKLWIKDFYRQI